MKALDPGEKTWPLRLQNAIIKTQLNYRYIVHKQNCFWLQEIIVMVTINRMMQFVDKKSTEQGQVSMYKDN